MREEINKLLNSDLSSNRIANETGVQQSTIYRLRSGERSLDNLGLKQCEKLYNYAIKVI
ncbi:MULTISPECIES: DNA-binding protein [Staphylococcus]|uniref:DNA-binding protein n=1 Tax=Staphylococcus TaxID=1279 RepID=UPI0011417716|nr:MULTISPECIES: DNA-binding protein [Staphylococcus]MBF8102579.1 DNA-binding protein [Staphylococcus epidermidis]MBM6164127.1 DNA-binding protein [Staphylococcus epidermidis]MBM6166258.1 DNA-binding protein [Staphylococcus epidermidis]MBM6168548.1 DNA-binding protein [Staphylococcus epidermidis]MBM6173005.1 DNA-binding protein [Staphylococcus epidermidis]